MFELQKTDLIFRKNYKLNFTDEIFEIAIVAILIANLPAYSLFDAEKKEINGNFYKKEHSLIGNKAD